MSKNMRNVRLQYSGFVVFAAKLVSVATGLVFQLMVARALLPAHQRDYDLWFNMNDVIAYFTLMGGVLPFWVMRYVARDKEETVKTGILANFAIGGTATIVYLLLIPLVISMLGISGSYLPVYFLVAIQIMEMYLIAVLEACLQARVPQTVGYGLMVQQLLKVILGYILIVWLNQLLLGVVVTTLAAIAFQTIYYFRLLAEEFRRTVKREYIKEWLKGSVATIYNVVGNQIAAYIFILLFVYGGEGARGRLGAAAVVVNVITYSSFLAYALYPKLLAERKSEDITTSMKMVLMFAIPMAIGAIALSDSYITILTESYRDSALVLMVLAVNSLLIVVSGLFSNILFGTETVDEGTKLSFRQLIRSRLFIAFSLPYLQSAMTVPTTFYVLTNFAQNQPLQAALYVSVIDVVARFIIFLFLYTVVRKMTKIYIPWRSITKYIFAAAVMGVVLYIIPHPTRILPTVAETAIGGIIYLGLLMLVDSETRTLPANLRREFTRQ